MNTITLSIATCQLCGAPVEYTNNKVIYGKPYGEWPMIYLCTNPRCRAFVHCHPGSSTPLGTMANSVTRRMRKLAHFIFDPLWKQGEMTRSDAYTWLAEQMEIPRDQCHIGMFDATQCQLVIDVVNKRNGNE